ncbi:MAG: hypothetical protein WCA35_19140 [Kovacikia sp.]
MSELSISSEIQSYAQAAVHWAKERFETKLDFSEESLKEVEIILDRLHKLLPQNAWGKLLKHSTYQREIVEMSLVWGSYVGEVIRQNQGGKWNVAMKSRDKSEILLQIQGISLFPMEKVSKRLTNGSGDDLWFYYQSFKQMQEQNLTHQKAA